MKPPRVLEAAVRVAIRTFAISGLGITMKNGPEMVSRAGVWGSISNFGSCAVY